MLDVLFLLNSLLICSAWKILYSQACMFVAGEYI